MASLYEIAGMYRQVLEMEPESEDEFGAMMTAPNSSSEIGRAHV